MGKLQTLRPALAAISQKSGDLVYTKGASGSTLLGWRARGNTPAFQAKQPRYWNGADFRGRTSTTPINKIFAKWQHVQTLLEGQRGCS